ncbi:MAG: proteasome accessory factor PafA2 family protein [Rubripirellula sp.]
MTPNKRQSETDTESEGQQPSLPRWRTDTPPDQFANAKPRSKPPSTLASRLMGLETEYATLILGTGEVESSGLPAAQQVYSALCDAISQDQPTVPGVFDHDQLFLANGSAVSFESHPTMQKEPGGFLEIATPEVHAPSELLTCQRSIDNLAADAAINSKTGFDIRILKNSRDALGHVYGCHENYQAEVAHGFFLLIYRVFILMLWGIQVLSLLASLPVMAAILAVVFLCKTLKRQPVSFDKPEDLFESVPRWVATPLLATLRCVHLPTVLVLRFVIRHIAFRRQRRCLTAFLVSRVVLCGTGTLDPNGRYHVSAKGIAVDSIADMGGFNGEKPIFVFGHWLGQFCAKSFYSLASTKQMFGRKQRLQIGLSDSNLSDLAEYVKVGSVSLLLDMIESGHHQKMIRIKSPIHALGRIASDWHLVTRVATNHGEMSALDIQKSYLAAAEAFVAGVPAAQQGEAPLILKRWRELLNAAVAYRKDASDFSDALGKIDWLTKRAMIDQMGPDSEWTDRKKIDLRYHELSNEGYFKKIAATLPGVQLVNQPDIERRRRSPPSNSPAARRGWLIREFADSEEKLLCDWGFALIGNGNEQRRIRFTDTHYV